MDINELNRGLLALLPEIALLVLGFLIIGGDLIVGESHKRRLGGLATIVQVAGDP